MDKKHIAKIFAGNKDLKEVHVTADDQVFFSKNTAHNHATHLKKKAVTIVSREDAAAWKTEKDEDKDSTDKGTGTGDKK